ncbi:hypothetical protein CsatB_008338 [Cannabis sativa]
MAASDMSLTDHSALIDELEKFRQPLSAAVDEEINLAIQNHQQVLPSSQPIS